MMEDQYYIYNIHNNIILKVHKYSPPAPSFDLHLEYFRSYVQDTKNADVEIVKNTPNLNSVYSIGSGDFFYDGVTFKSQNLSVFIRENGQWIILSNKSFPPHLLIQFQCLNRSWTLIHGAGISFRGKGILFPAWGNTGKTTLISQFIKDDSCQILGDDFIILSADSKMYSFPLPFSLYHYHASLFPEVFKKKKRKLFKGKLLKVIRMIKTFIKPIVQMHPKVESFLRNLSPEYMVVPVNEIVNREKICDNTKLSMIIYLEKFSGNYFVFEEVKQEDLIKNMIGILQYELEESPFWKEILAMSSFGIIDLHNYIDKIYQIIKLATKNVKCYKLKIPNETNINEYYKIVKQKVENEIS